MLHLHLANCFSTYDRTWTVLQPRHLNGRWKVLQSIRVSEVIVLFLSNTRGRYRCIRKCSEHVKKNIRPNNYIRTIIMQICEQMIIVSLNYQWDELLFNYQVGFRHPTLRRSFAWHRTTVMSIWDTILGQDSIPCFGFLRTRISFG